MRLWTLQPASWHDHLCGRGRIAGDWRRVDRDFVPAYRWMAAQMVSRRVCRSPVPPLWAWHSYDGRHERPDLRVLRQSEPGVRIELEAPDELVLLSNYEAWHAVLNRWHLSLSGTESRRIERLHGDRPPQHLMEASWSRIFDLTAGDPAWRGDPATRSVQACLPYVDLAWVRPVDRYKGRRCP